MSGAPMQTLRGLGVAPGVGIGRAICLESKVEVYRFPLAEGEVDAEVERFREALEAAGRELAETRAKATEDLAEELAALFDAHALLLRDSAVRGRIERRIVEDRVNAEWAVHRTAEELLERFDQLDVPHLRERAEDLRDVSRHLLRALHGVSDHHLSEVEGPVVIVAHDLTPSDAVRLGRQEVLGFAVETGGRTSHTAIIARSLNIPLVAGLDGVTVLADDDDPLIVDGNAGLVVLHPSTEALESYRQRQAVLIEADEERAATRELPAVTQDGVAVSLMANIDLPEEIDDARRFGAAGVGLYRSEFLYIERSPELPGEDEQLELFRRLIASMKPHRVTIRTFDLGGRKLAREVMDTREDNPVLGLRGIRLTLARREIFRTQLRALFRAARDEGLDILLPMVSTLDEIHSFRSFADEVMEELTAEGVPFSAQYRLGAMIEVPAAAVIADMLADEVDFLSLGTNDLIQYSLAVDRNNEHVAYLYRPLHPAILRMIRFVADSAAGAGIDLSICGEMAADPSCTMLLLGLGLRRFSVSPRQIPEVKTLVRGVSIDELTRVTQRCLALRSAVEVAAELERSVGPIPAGG